MRTRYLSKIWPPTDAQVPKHRRVALGTLSRNWCNHFSWSQINVIFQADIHYRSLNPSLSIIDNIPITPFRLLIIFRYHRVDRQLNFHYCRSHFSCTTRRWNKTKNIAPIPKQWCNHNIYCAVGSVVPSMRWLDFQNCDLGIKIMSLPSTLALLS